jgi:hypothetical protein
MMKGRSYPFTGAVLAGCLSLTGLLHAATPEPLAGGILGQVKSSTGIAQMGATVFLYNRYDQLVRQALSNEQGKFAFDKLPPDLYSLRVSLSSFMPALRRNIAVAAGSENILQINLTNVLSTIELISAGPSRGTLISDDWRWVLRTSHATRPVLRLMPTQQGTSSSASTLASRFSDTTGMVKLSAGDSADYSGAAAQDIGTLFGVSASYAGNARVRLAGNLGFLSNSGLPAAGIRAHYSRGTESNPGPEVTLTVRQLFAPTRLGSGTPADSLPGLRTMSLAALDHLEILDGLRLEYGFNLESVSFLRPITHASPFARATYDLGAGSSVKLAYAAGMQPGELTPRPVATSSEAQPGLEADLAALAVLPRVSLLNHDPRVQRTETYEAGFTHVDGGRTYSVVLYRDAMNNAAFLLSAPHGFLPPGDTLPDLASNSRVFNVGNFNRTGYTASVTQALGDHFDATVAAGRGGAMVAGLRPAEARTAEDLRNEIRTAQRGWVTARVAVRITATGTRIATSYGWTDFRALTPAHVFLTQNANQEIGWNLNVRQPLPQFPGLPGRIEAVADLRNLLAQGYLPVNAGGQTGLLVNTPRAVRGGLNFIF